MQATDVQINFDTATVAGKIREAIQPLVTEAIDTLQRSCKGPDAPEQPEQPDR